MYNLLLRNISRVLSLFRSLCYESFGKRFPCHFRLPWRFDVLSALWWRSSPCNFARKKIRHETKNLCSPQIYRRPWFHNIKNNDAPMAKFQSILVVTSKTGCWRESEQIIAKRSRGAARERGRRRNPEDLLKWSPIATDKHRKIDITTCPKMLPASFIKN